MSDTTSEQEGGRSAYTPGPWTVHPARDGSGDCGIKAAGAVNIHAEVFAEFWAKGDLQPAEANANASLIAAAPDLLEALRELYAATPDNEGGALGIACRKARAAITKATGAA